jgi:putative Mg2+ transporter-C (MgtC) family protein
METLFIDSEITIFLQLIFAMFLGMVLGGERAIAGKTAGMRTYALVSMGAALFIIISTTVTKQLIGITDVDPLRVLSGIITGIGFIGAGLIIFRESTLRGLTTAAGLWVAAGVGVSVGYKFYLLALFSTILTLFVFTILWFVENRLKFFAFNGNSTEVVETETEEDLA